MRIFDYMNILKIGMRGWNENWKRRRVKRGIKKDGLDSKISFEKKKKKEKHAIDKDKICQEKKRKLTCSPEQTHN